VCHSPSNPEVIAEALEITGFFFLSAGCGDPLAADDPTRGDDSLPDSGQPCRTMKQSIAPQAKRPTPRGRPPWLRFSTPLDGVFLVVVVGEHDGETSPGGHRVHHVVHGHPAKREGGLSNARTLKSDALKVAEVKISILKVGTR
jgi:hypothetical protein